MVVDCHPLDRLAMMMEHASDVHFFQRADARMARIAHIVISSIQSPCVLADANGVPKVSR
jgi:hypothetical protein